MALGLGLKPACIASIGLLAGLSCSAGPRPSPVAAGEPRERLASVEPAPPSAPAAGAPWPAREQLLLVKTRAAELVLRAAGTSFVYGLARDAQRVLYDPAFELVWFSNAGGLWVVDLRDPAPESIAPVLVASQLPPHVEIQVDRGGTDYVAPHDSCDLEPVLELHWVEAPWIEGRDGLSFDALEGHAWLASERSRKPRAASAERWFHPADPHVFLPAARAHCEDPLRCGALLPFAASPWQLILTDQTEGADCWHFGCLLRDTSTGAFGTPPRPSHWGAAEQMPSGSCGPYRFNADDTAFLVEDSLCTSGGNCQPLDGVGLGWLIPGVAFGAPG